MAMHNTHARSHGVFRDLLCHCREGSHLRRWVNFWQVNINAGDSFIFDFSY